MKSRFRTVKLAALVAVSAAAAAGLAGCSGSGSAATADSTGGQTLTVWQFETPGSAVYEGELEANKIFEKEHPGDKVKFVTTSFNSVRQNAKLLLSGNDIPNVMEVNKGNADGGQLAAQGLLTNLTPEVKKEGWDKIVTGSMQDLARYSKTGNAGSGDWYGIPNSGQYYLLFYNKTLFAKAGIPVPTTAAGLVSAMAAFEAKGETPVSTDAGEFGLAQLWYQFVSAKATRAQIDNYMFLRGKTDFSSGPFAAASEELQDWLKKGYLGTDLGGLTENQKLTAFVSGKYPLMPDGSWDYTAVKSGAKFPFGTMVFPDSAYNEGATGQLWTVPAKATNKNLAYDYINITLSKPVQNLIGKLGGLPLRQDPAAITDPQTKAFTAEFNTLKAQDVLSFYPDYPVTGELNFLESEMQGMANGTKTAAQFDKDLQAYYDAGMKQIKQ